MNTFEKSKLVSLASLYISLAKEHSCTTIQQLSKLTYQLRETGEDIPYLAVMTKNNSTEIYAPAPTVKQKNWKFLKEENFVSNIRTEDGFTVLEIVKGEVDSSKATTKTYSVPTIIVRTVSKVSGERVETILFEQTF